MAEKKQIIITIIVILAVLALFYFGLKAIIGGNTVASPNNGLEDFNKCLAQKGAVMYGAFWCSHCQNQKLTLGNSAFIPFVECDPRGENSKSDLCLSKGIQGYPTWEINGKLMPGEKSLQTLSELTGCALPA